MILQELYYYYERKAALGEIALQGWIKKDLDFLFVINQEGECVGIDFLIDDDNNGKSYIVPCIGKQALKHTNSGVDANLLWDKTAFVLGVDKDEKKREKKLGSFIKTIQTYFPGVQNSSLSAILTFLSACRASKDYIPQIVTEYLSNDVEQERILSGEPSISFRMSGNHQPVFEEQEIRNLYTKYVKTNESKSDDTGVCLVSGLSEQPIESKHPVIKGVRGAQASGAAIVSFNEDAFCSYKWHKKRNGKNAQVSKKAVDAYTKTLNHLLKHEQNHLVLGNMTLVFWAERSCELEDNWSLFFVGPPKDDPDKDVRAVKQLYESITSGRLVKDNKNRFFVLGLAPNDARLSVQYWRSGKVKEFAERLTEHFEYLKIECGPNDTEYFSLNKLLLHTALNYKKSEIQSNLPAAVIKAILDDTPYPVSLLHACIRRIRAEQHVTHIRAAILKACINKYNRFHHKTEKEEILMSLDKNNMNPAYLFGRLFAVLERIQIESAKPNKLNSTIRDRYYGAASSTPITVFPKLIKLKNHHIEKLSADSQRMFEAMIGEIMAGIDAEKIPTQLPLEQQTRFAIGYYQQMWYRKRFKLTQQALQALREHDVPDAILQGLEVLAERKFKGKKNFETEVIQVIGKEHARTYKELILTYADEEEREINNIMSGGEDHE